MGCSAVCLICFPSLPNSLWNFLWCRCCFQSFQPRHNHTVFLFLHHITLDGRSIRHLICSYHKSWKWTFQTILFFLFYLLRVKPHIQLCCSSSSLSTNVDFKFSSPINSSASCRHSVICNETQAHEMFCNFENRWACRDCGCIVYRTYGASKTILYLGLKLPWCTKLLPGSDIWMLPFIRKKPVISQCSSQHTLSTKKLQAFSKWKCRTLD